MKGSVRNRKAYPWLLLYFFFIVLAIPFAQPIWNAYFEDSLGLFISVEMIHVIQYALFALLASWWYFGIKTYNNVFIHILVLAFVGLLDESLQSLFPNRYFQWSDVLLNWVGVIIGVTFFMGIKRIIKANKLDL